MLIHPIPATRHVSPLLLVLTLASALALPGQALAARSSKPKEIVVVGSKVKEVIRSAGFGIEGNVIAALGGRILANLEAAMDRAERNGRYSLRAEDLDCPTAPERGDARMNKSELIEHIAKNSGFTTEPGFLAALNAYSNQIVAEAVHRAGANKRGTVRPHDL
ncbi:MAG: hypothetical protein JRH10_21875 [Deltaproteobacteria bacterium]|nr:hypothetical protein [Deltaproteobacteria bacterium]